jgi:hypothetical protein
MQPTERKLPPPLITHEDIEDSEGMALKDSVEINRRPLGEIDFITPWKGRRCLDYEGLMDSEEGLWIHWAPRKRRGRPPRRKVVMGRQRMKVCGSSNPSDFS